MGARSDLNVSERREAVLALLCREEPAKVLARRYGVSEKTLYSWRDDFVRAGRAVRIPKWQGWAKGAKAKLNQLLAEEAA